MTASQVDQIFAEQGGIEVEVQDGKGTPFDVISLSLGTAAAPSLTFTGDIDTGFWSPAADTLAVSTAGVERLRIDSIGRFLVGTSTPFQANAFNLSFTSLFHLAGTSFTTASTLNSYWNDNATGSGVYQFAKSRGSLGVHTIVQSGDRIGGYSFTGSDGAKFIEAARIEAAVDGTPGANDMPGRLVFSTTPAGAASPTERMRITAAGTVRVAAVLSAANTTSNTSPVNSNASTTATASSLLNGIRTGTPTAGIDLQVPTGTNMDAAFAGLQNNQGFQWSVINLAAATHAITVTANDDHTVVGNMIVAASTSGRFLTRKTAANTFFTYRIA
jgi:hypothetical protein